MPQTSFTQSDYKDRLLNKIRSLKKDNDTRRGKILCVTDNYELLWLELKTTIDDKKKYWKWWRETQQKLQNKEFEILELKCEIKKLKCEMKRGSHELKKIRVRMIERTRNTWIL